jgi:hypothetical protein
MVAKYEVDTDKVVAVVINPKTRELLEVWRHENSSVILRHPGAPTSHLGKAYFDPSEEYDVGSDTYKRGHSPGSGVEKGKGYGVALYSGLCLRAYSDTAAMGIASSDGGKGHSGRSVDADRFWERCVANDLAEEDSVDTSEMRDYKVDSDYFDDYFDSCDQVGDDECEEVRNVRGDVTVEYLAGGLTDFQYMPAGTVADKGLIFADVGSRAFPDFVAPNADVIASLNLENCYDVGLAEMVIEYAFAEGYDLVYVERLARMLPPKVRRATSVSSQLRLDFVSNSAKAREVQRKVEREVTQVWKSAYGGLTDID